jgi:hypothetical protein
MNLKPIIGNSEGTAKTEISKMMMAVPSGKSLSRKTTTSMEEEGKNSTIAETETWTVSCAITGSLEKEGRVLKWVRMNLCRRKGAGEGEVECLDGVVLEKEKIIS